MKNNMTLRKANEAIEKIQELLSEVSTLGWDINDYMEKRYKDVGYDYIEDVIPDENDREIARVAKCCGMIDTMNDFMFGDLRVKKQWKRK